MLVPPNHQQKLHVYIVYLFYNNIHLYLHILNNTYAKLIKVIEERIPVEINFGGEKRARL